MLKVKSIKPSHREKKRYLVYEASEPISSRDMISQLQTMLGLFMSSQAGLIHIAKDDEKKRGIIRINHTAVDYIKSCFVLTETFNGKTNHVHSIGVSGMLGKAKEIMNA